MMVRKLLTLAGAVVLGAVTSAALLLFGASGSKPEVEYEEGKQLFLSRCSACHAREAGAESPLGPSLFALGERAGARVPKQNAAEYVVTSLFEPSAFVVPGFPPVMPGQLLDDLSDEEIRSLVGYVLNLGSEVHADMIAAVKIPARAKHRTFAFDRSELERGAALFWGDAQCALCHSTHADAHDGNVAPRIFHVGLAEARIRQALKAHVAPDKASTLVALTLGSSGGGPSAEGAPAGTGGGAAVPAVPAVEGVVQEDDAGTLVLLGGPWPPRELRISTKDLAPDASTGIRKLDHPARPLSEADVEALVKLLLILN